MLNISYNVSPKLNDSLSKIEDLRKQILLTPIPPAVELRLRWEATFNRTYASLNLSGSSIDKNEVLRILSEIRPGKMNKNQHLVLGFKKANDFIAQNWLGAAKTINAHDLIEIYGMIDGGKLRVPEAGLQYLLDYLQAKSENPIIQAGIVGIEMEKMQLFSENNKLISLLTSNLFLYRYGYDFRGFLAYEKEWTGNNGTYKDNHERALSAASLTLWLEYFAESILKQLEIINQFFKAPPTATLDLKESYWKLNERQKSLLNFLSQPQATITNRQVQKRYNISQITASRDLVRLTNLGYLLSHGKGRSVYYTKI